MRTTKEIIAENLTVLRKTHHFTQAELAERFHYSDKAISRWERGEALPDVEVLCDLCRFYGITLDYLVSEHRGAGAKKEDAERRGWTATQGTLCALMITTVWMVATFCFVTGQLFAGGKFPFLSHGWDNFVIAVPMSLIAVLPFRYRWGMRPVPCTLLYSAILWTSLAAAYLCQLHYNLWMLFILGIPVQVMLFLWLQMKAPRKETGDSPEAEEAEGEACVQQSPEGEKV